MYRTDSEVFIESVIKEVDKQRTKQRHQYWQRAYETLKDKFPSEVSSREQVRSLYRYHKGTYHKDFKLNKYHRAEMEQIGLTQIAEKILNRTNRKHTVESLAERLELTQEQLLTEISKLELSGIIFNKWRENGRSYIMKSKKQNRTDYNSKTILEPATEYKFLVIGDTHVGHEATEHDLITEVINHAYDKHGVRKVFHTGDITDGHYLSIRPNSIEELIAIGLDAQVELADQVFPKRDGLEYYAISGNHDATFNRHSYANPGIYLSRIRDDFHYLGHNYAKIEISKHVDVTLIHPDDGIGENYALKLRQHIDRNTDERLGRFIFMGHYHKFAHLHHKGRDAWVTPSFMRQSGFMATKNLESLVGAMIVTLRLDNNGELVSFTPEYFFFD